MLLMMDRVTITTEPCSILLSSSSLEERGSREMNNRSMWLKDVGTTREWE